MFRPEPPNVELRLIGESVSGMRYAVCGMRYAVRGTRYAVCGMTIIFALDTDHRQNNTTTAASENFQSVDTGRSGKQDWVMSFIWTIESRRIKYELDSAL